MLHIRATQIRRLAGIRFLTPKQFTNPSKTIRLSEKDNDDNEDIISVSIAEARISNFRPEHMQGLTVFISSAMLVTVPLPNGNVRVVIPLAHGQMAPKEPSVEYIQSMLEARGNGRDGSKVEEIVWGSRFQVQSLIAERCYIPSASHDSGSSIGGVLLIGDAAHCHSPAGGQGMNLGIRDAISLGEALRLALNGDGDALSRFEKERQSVALKVIKMTEKMLWVGSRTGVAGKVRNGLFWCAGRLGFPQRKAALRLSGFAFDR